MSELSLRWFAITADVSLKVLLLAVATGFVLRVLRIRNSNLRHAAWLGLLVAMFALPLMSPILPAIPVPLPFRPDSYLPQTLPSPTPVAEAKLTSLDLPPEPLSPGTSVGSESFSFSIPQDGNGQSQGPMRVDTTFPSEPVVVESQPTITVQPQVEANVSGESSGRNRWPEAIVALWGVGVLALAARLFFAVFVTRRMVRRSTPILEASALVGQYEEKASRDRLSGKRGALRESADILVPLTTGVIRSTILLPADWKTWPAEKLGHVLVHEQTHVKRRDCWTALVVELAACLYWFHPLVWWLRRRLAVLAEECCDDAAIAASGNRTGYARHLLEIAGVLCGQRGRLVYSGFSMARRSNVETRIHAILDFNRPLSRRLTWSATLLLAAVIVPMIAVAAALRPAERTVESAEGEIVNDVSTAGEFVTEIELGTVKRVEDIKQPNAKADVITVSETAPTTPAAVNSTMKTRLHGRISNAADQPTAGAFIAVVASRITNDRGYVPESLAEGVTNDKGEYELTLRGVIPKDFAEPKLVVRAAGQALAWQAIDLTQKNSQFDVALRPEQLIQVRLIDIQGQPAADVSVGYLGIAPMQGKGDGTRGYWQYSYDWPNWKAAPPPLQSDETGLLTIPHVPADHGAWLLVAGNEQFAPQFVSLNTGRPEQREPTDGSYRGLIKNFQPGEIGTVALAPARFFEGVVRLGSTDKPAAHAKISMWASDQEPHGSMVSIDGETDADGRFRLNPYPGVRFGINAYPPAGSPYQIRKLDNLKWETGDSVRRIEIRLPLGVLAKGTIVDADTGQPLAGASVQYNPNRAKNKNLSEDLITGWQSLRPADEHGRFEIPVAAGPGMLLVHAPAGTSYILEEKGSLEIDRGQLGGRRYYAHAFQKIDPPVPDEDAGNDEKDTTPPLTIKLQAGGTVMAKLVDTDGKPVPEAKFTSRIFIVPTNPFWRAYSQDTKNGLAEFRGLKPGEKYPVFVLNVKRQIGAMAEISLDDPQPTIVLKPCATAKARFVDPQQKPAKMGQMFLLSMVVTPGVSEYTSNPVLRFFLAADEDFSTNFDNVRSGPGPLTDETGAMTYRLLVPGAAYRFVNQGNVEKEFIAESGKEHDLGDIVVDLGEDNKQSNAKANATLATEKKPATSVASKTDSAEKNAQELEFHGKVVDAEGRPVAKAEVWFAVSSYRDDDTPADSMVRSVAMSDQGGDFSFRFKGPANAEQSSGEWTHRMALVAKAPGHGFDWLPLAAFDTNPVVSEQRDKLQQMTDKALGAGRFAGRTLKLPKAAGPVRGRLVDLEGRPLKDVAVLVDEILNPDPALLNEAFTKSSSELMVNARYARQSLWGSELNRRNWQTLMPPVKTNANGEFSLDGLGRDQLAMVTISGERAAAERLFILGTEMETKRVPHISHGAAQDVYVGLQFDHAVGPAVPVHGVVTEFQSGKPIANATVFVERLFGNDGERQLLLGTRHMRAVTDEQGCYRLLGVPPGESHELNVIPPKSDPWLIAAQTISIPPDQPAAKVDIKVFRGIWMEGRVTDAQTGKPVPGFVDYLALAKNPNIPQRFGLHDNWQTERFPIAADGRYRTAGLPGPGVLQVRAFGKTVYPRSVGAEKIEGYDTKWERIPTTPSSDRLWNWHLIQSVDPPSGAESHQLDLTLSAGIAVVGRIVGPNEEPVSRIEATGQEEKTWNVAMLPGDKFTVHNYDPAVPRNLFFKAADKSLVGFLHLKGVPPADLTVRLQPSITVQGRLIESEAGRPAVGFQFHCESSKHGDFSINDWVTYDRVTTDAKGRFEIKGLLAGTVYEMDSFNKQHRRSGKNKFTIDLTDAKPGDVVELGDVTGKKANKK